MVVIAARFAAVFPPLRPPLSLALQNKDEGYRLQGGKTSSNNLAEFPFTPTVNETCEQHAAPPTAVPPLEIRDFGKSLRQISGTPAPKSAVSRSEYSATNPAPKWPLFCTRGLRIAEHSRTAAEKPSATGCIRQPCRGHPCPHTHCPPVSSLVGGQMFFVGLGVCKESLTRPKLSQPSIGSEFRQVHLPAAALYVVSLPGTMCTAAPLIL